MKRKKIAVNTRFLLKDKLEGIGRFTREALMRITQQHPEYDFVFLFDRDYSDEFIFADNVKPYVIGPPARHPMLWYLWFEWGIPHALKKIKPDLFLSTDGYCSLSTNIDTVMVVHDIAFEHSTNSIPFLVEKFYRYFTPKYVQKAQRLATVSNYTKTDIVQQYGAVADKIDVVYNGVNEEYRPLTEAEKIAVKQEFVDGKDYFLSVGAIHPRKNLANILRAFERFKKKNNAPTQFLVAGRKAWQCKEAFEVFNNMEFKEDVRFLGHLDIQTLSKVLGASTALVYPSIFEGFGIPIIEAMKCEVPVITSDVSSMPEVAGDAALLVQPHSIESIETAMCQIHNDPLLRKSLIEKSKLQHSKFTWQQTADRLWECMDQVLKN